MAQVTTVTSEALQSQIRTLLPSQRGFGEDLQASNVIIPIVDLTSTAEGSTLPANLQTAIAYGSQTAFSVTNTTTTIANTAGFYRVTAMTFTRTVSSGTLPKIEIIMNDGATDKTVWAQESDVTSYATSVGVNIDYTFFLRSNDSLKIKVASANGIMAGSIRQIADVTGNLVNPSGFVSQ